MRFSSLASGSAGNALLVEVAGTRLMIDCGLGLAACMARLAARGWEPESVAAILVTHEHGDHIGGVARFARKFGTQVLGTHGTLGFLSERLDPAQCREIDGHAAFALGDAWIEPFCVPHDARQPVQYVVGDGARRLGVLTDAGRSTPHIEARLSDCDALVLECNHDAAMLRAGPYPASLKERVSGPFGHLENGVAAALLTTLRRDRLRHVIAAHLSLQNNTPALARAALAGALTCSEDWIGVATQEDGFAWRDV